MIFWSRRLKTDFEYYFQIIKYVLQIFLLKFYETEENYYFIVCNKSLKMIFINLLSMPLYAVKVH